MKISPSFILFLELNYRLLPLLIRELGISKSLEILTFILYDYTVQQRRLNFVMHNKHSTDSRDAEYSGGLEYLNDDPEYCGCGFEYLNDDAEYSGGVEYLNCDAEYSGGVEYLNDDAE
jgi:hypothetical protein